MFGMHQIKRLGLTLCLVAFAVLSSKAQLTLKECLQFALQHNQDIAIQRYNERTGAEKIKETTSQAYPQVNALGFLQDNVQKQVLVLPPGLGAALGAGKGPIPISLTYQLTAQGTFTQKIYDQSVFTGIKAAKAGMDYYTMNTALTETQVIEMVSQLYFRYQVTLTQVAVLDSNIANISKVESSTQSQFENGLARKIDVDRLKVNLVNLRTERTSLIDSISQQGYQLRYFLGMGMDDPLSLLPFSAASVESEIGVGVSLDSGMNLNNRLEYTILKKEAQLEGYQLKANKAAFYPSVDLQGYYSTNGVSDNFDFIGHGTTAIWYQTGYLTLNLRVPIWDGGGRKSRVHQAQILIDQYNKQAEQAASQLDLDYRNSKIYLQTSINTIRAQKDNMELAREVYLVTQSNYNQGLSTLTDLLDAENSFLASENNYNGALLQYKLAQIGLIKANGNLKSLLN